MTSVELDKVLGKSKRQILPEVRDYGKSKRQILTEVRDCGKSKRQIYQR